MAEFIAIPIQTVAAGQNVLFSDTRSCGSRCVAHRDGSGVVTLRGNTNQCRAKFRVSFGGNIAVPTGGTVGEINLAIAIDGEPDLGTTMLFTPAAVDVYGNVHADTFVDVPCGDNVRVSVENTSDQPILIQNANLSTVRVA